MSLAPKVFPETGVPQDPLASDLRDLQEKKVSRVSQEDPEVPAYPVLKVNQAYQWLRKAYQDPEDRTASQDGPAHQVAQVPPDRMVSLVYQERRVTLDSQVSDFQDPQELKDSQVLPASQELLQHQADQE